jgi:hypothetical protein
VYISNCSGKRMEMMNEIINLKFPVDTYGKCFDGKIPEDSSKIENMGKYKFYFAFENSETDDYITEKFFQCFEGF